MPKLDPPESLDPIHPGEILRHEFLEPLGLTANDLARGLPAPASRIRALLNGHGHITAGTAFQLAVYFGTTPDLWMGLQADYDLRKAQRGNPARATQRV